MTRITIAKTLPQSATRRRVLSLTAAGCVAPWVGAARAQDTWPSKPLRMVVGYAAGSGIDSTARQLARYIEGYAGQPVIVDNRAGALGNIGAQAVAAAAGDSHTMLFTPNSTHAANVHLFKKMPFDPVRDFSPVSSVATLGFVLVCDPQALKVSGVPQLLAQLRKDPSKFTYGSGNATGLVAGAMFKSMAGVDLLGVPYKSVPQAMTDLLGGRLQLVFADATLAIPMVKAGKLQALAVTGRERIAALPQVPTMAESGLPGYDLSGWFAVFMPARVPPAIVQQLSGHVQRALKEPALADFLRSIGCEPASSTPDELARRVVADTDKWGRLVKLAGIEPE
jgi:tripartite-type tricarboxylate transporter receptor subunit TctC